MLSDQELKRIRWASRRGMLELDLMLVPFVEERLIQLDGADQQRYVDLLEEEDTDLFAWLLRRGEAENPENARIIALIIQHALAAEV